MDAVVVGPSRAPGIGGIGTCLKGRPSESAVRPSGVKEAQAVVTVAAQLRAFWPCPPSRDACGERAPWIGLSPWCLL
jgi:hypothetical protein